MASRGSCVNNMERFFNNDYLFDDFLLNSSGVLSFHGQEIAVPPKELQVLVTLLEGKGQMVHKNFIIDKVWGDNLVGDESLTRCIYALRRLLRESKNNKFIETVYGKGYRFSKTVTLMPRQRQAPGQCKLAIFPFRGAQAGEAEVLQAQLLDQISGSQPAGVSIVPATLTREFGSVDDLLGLCHQLALDFYLSGEFRTQSREPVLVVELVEASCQKLLWRETLKLDGCISWSQRLESLPAEVSLRLPLSTDGVREASSNEVLLSHVMARRCLRVRQPGDLSMALQYLQMGLVQDPLHVPSLTSLAETWLAMALQGEVWPAFAFSEAKSALDKALALAPQNAVAQGVMGWLNCLSQAEVAHVAGNGFRQALSQADAAAELFLYHALQLTTQGDFEHAEQVLRVGLAKDGNLVPAQIHRLWLLNAMGRSDDAVAYGLSLAGQRSMPPRFHSVLAMILQQSGQQAKAQAYANLALERSPTSLPEQIQSTMVLAASEPASARQKLKLWSSEAQLHYRCPALLACLALCLGENSQVDALLDLAHQQACVWLPLVRVSPRMQHFLGAQSPKGGA